MLSMFVLDFMRGSLLVFMFLLSILNLDDTIEHYPIITFEHFPHHVVDRCASLKLVISAINSDQFLNQPFLHFIYLLLDCLLLVEPILLYLLHILHLVLLFMLLLNVPINIVTNNAHRKDFSCLHFS